MVQPVRVSSKEQVNLLEILFKMIVNFINIFDGWLVGFYGLSTIEGYLIPKPFLFI